MSVIRTLDLISLLKNKSFFLFGARSTGKSQLIKSQLGKKAQIFDLLRSDIYLKLASDPSSLENMITDTKGSKNWIVLDEIQKIPQLLDEVHRLIEDKKYKFLLTGSSARKLKSGQANLLAGRAWTANLFPLTYFELSNSKHAKFDLDRYLRYGGLPNVYLSKLPHEELNAYVKTYLYEEIQAEGVVRKLPQFSRFLITAALSNGLMLNFSQIGSDTALAASTVKEYFHVLEDTLLGFFLEPWVKSKKRKSITTSKFYLFDTGVTHTLAQTKSIDRNSDLYGRSFEQFIAMELRAYLSYKRIDDQLAYWRSTHDQEVDFIIGDHTAIEVKSTKRISDRDLNGLVALSEEKIFKKFYLVTHDRIEMTKKHVTCLPWQVFLDRLWNGEIF